MGCGAVVGQGVLVVLPNVCFVLSDQSVGLMLHVQLGSEATQRRVAMFHRLYHFVRV